MVISIESSSVEVRFIPSQMCLSFLVICLLSSCLKIKPSGFPLSYTVTACNRPDSYWGETRAAFRVVLCYSLLISLSVAIYCVWPVLRCLTSVSVFRSFSCCALVTTSFLVFCFVICSVLEKLLGVTSGILETCLNMSEHWENEWVSADREFLYLPSLNYFIGYIFSGRDPVIETENNTPGHRNCDIHIILWRHTGDITFKFPE